MAVQSNDPEVQKLLDKLNAVQRLRRKAEMTTLEAEGITISNPFFILDSIIELCKDKKQSVLHNNRKYETIISLSEFKVFSFLEEIYDSNIIDRIAKDIKLTKTFHSKLISTHTSLKMYNSDYTDRIKGLLLMFESELILKAKNFKPQKTLKKYLPNNEIVHLTKTPPIEKEKKRKPNKIKSIFFKIRSISIMKIIGLSILISVFFGYANSSTYDYYNGQKITYNTFNRISKENELYLLENKYDFNSYSALSSGLICLGLLLALSKTNNKH